MIMWNVQDTVELLSINLTPKVSIKPGSTKADLFSVLPQSLASLFGFPAAVLLKQLVQGPFRPGEVGHSARKSALCLMALGAGGSF